MLTLSWKFSCGKFQCSMKNGLILLRRLICCKFTIVQRLRQMWFKNTAFNSFNRINALSRGRKVIVLALLLLAALYYLIPSLFKRSPSSSLIAGVSEPCLRDRLRWYEKKKDAYDTFINNSPPKPEEKYFPPYVGNGHLAAALDSRNGLFVRLNRALSVPVKYYPVVTVSIDAAETSLKEASTLNIRDGIAYKTQILKSNSHWEGPCASVETWMYAHRSRDSVLVQDIKISNPTKNALVVDIDQVGASGWKDAVSTVKSANSHVNEKKDYSITSGSVETRDAGIVIFISVASIKTSDKFLSIPAGKVKTMHILTIVHYSAPMEASKADQKKITTDLEEKVTKDVTAVFTMKPKDLQAEHSKVWNTLWESGFGISHSKATGALNANKINSTIYYVLSNTVAPLHSLTSTQEEKVKIRKTLHYPDRCYGGHSTLHANTLWVDITDEDDIARVTTTWMITLEKQGCATMVKSGAEGVLQAIILSLGSFHFANDHLEFAMEPGDLHRDLFFHRISYGNNTHLNVSVIVGDDNKALIFVSLDRNDRPYYACDAGCIDPPMALSKEIQQFPVKLTKPLTSILYITADKVHMEELKHAIHVKEINEAPAHEHHVIALHRHGHHFGGLPTLFWVSVAILVILFHMFLCKLIYNEYFQGNDKFGRTRYNV